MSILGKDSVAKSVFNLTCPKCHEGKLFKTPTLSFSKPADMPDQCPVCGQAFMLEPGFYYGAMFISYILIGFLSIGFVATLHFGYGIDLVYAFIALFALTAIFYIYLFRFSRSLWIHVNVKYDPEVAKAK